jgi:hypothetical protein
MGMHLLGQSEDRLLPRPVAAFLRTKASPGGTAYRRSMVENALNNGGNIGKADAVGK